jgi:hypothetical protein
MVRALLVACACVAGVVVAGCYEDDYRCTSDDQCNLGEGGRCEVNNYCTKYDDDCTTTERRYQHAGPFGNECFEDVMPIANRCAGGQPPAKRDGGCIDTVCDLLPSCCSLSWTDACVQIAQQVCVDLACETRIALNATPLATPELYDLRWDGMRWHIAGVPPAIKQFQWIAPPPGGPDPRAVVVTDDELKIDGLVPVAIPLGRVYDSITTINFDRDMRDTIIATHVKPAPDALTAIDIIKPPNMIPRQHEVTTPANITWGDIDRRDGFPDAIASPRNSAQYHYVKTFDEKTDVIDHVRTLSVSVAIGPGTPTEPVAQFQSAEWMDVNRDKALDIVAFGAAVRVHTHPTELRDAPEHVLDCNPPSEQRPCPAPTTAADTSFTGAALPALGKPELLIATFPGPRRLLRTQYNGATIDTAVPIMSFPTESCSCTLNGQMQWVCNTCPHVVAVIVRDLDGDHALDAVVIDAHLNLYWAFGPDFTTWRLDDRMKVMSPANYYREVRYSVTGAVTRSQ